MKVKKIIVFFLVIGILFILQNISYAGEQEWTALDFKVNLKSNGSIDVAETWDMYISETNTVFKDFDVDSTKMGEITDVSVFEIMDDGSYYHYNQIYEEQYHVDDGCFYALPINGGSQFEIAWNVGMDSTSGTRKFLIEYTITDVVKVYNDCSEFYWMFLNNSHGVDGNNITGTISLPKSLNDMENLRVWAHGPLTGEIYKKNEYTLEFNVPSLNSNEMLETRVVVQEDIFNEASKIDSDRLESILEEEQKWADEANRRRMMWKAIIGVIIVVNVVGFYVFILKAIKKYINEGKEIKQSKIHKTDIEYFRDIPDGKNATPSRALFLYNQKNGKEFTEKAKAFSATIMDLTLKGYFNLEPISKDNVKINLIKEYADGTLTPDEVTVFEVIKKAASAKNEVTTKELQKFCRREYDYVISKMDFLPKYAKRYMVETEKIDKKQDEFKEKYSTRVKTYSILLFIMFCCWPLWVIAPALAICCILGIIFCSINKKKINVFTQEGYELASQWHGLKKYMSEYSLLKERETPDLVLWEQYLVYATAFGISKKVIEQLKVTYPEIYNDSFDSRNYSLIYLVSNSRMGDNFASLDKCFSDAYRAASTAYTSAHSSSRKRWWRRLLRRRRRRPVAVEVPEDVNL